MTTQGIETRQSGDAKQAPSRSDESPIGAADAPETPIILSHELVPERYVVEEAATPILTEREAIEAREIETVTGDFMQDKGEPFWRIEVDGYCADFDHKEAADNFAARINERIALSHRLATEGGLRGALERIADGDEPRPLGKSYFPDGRPSKHDHCTHGVWMHETCGNCLSEFARSILASSPPSSEAGMTTPDALREAVARIIDPDIMSDLACDQLGIGEAYRPVLRDKLLAKADAILAALSPSPVKDALEAAQVADYAAAPDLLEEMEWIRAFAAMRSEDDSKTFARVNRGALRTIAQRCAAAIAKAKGPSHDHP